MKASTSVTILILLILSSCQQKANTSDVEKWKQEIIQAELDFTQMAQEKGIHDAFVAFCADGAAIKRNGKLISGKDNIDSHLLENNAKTLIWAPDFVDVSQSGDLGYTYGKFTFSYVDESGDSLQNEGIFHTVWKRQKDGKWKFVWD